MRFRTAIAPLALAGAAAAAAPAGAATPGADAAALRQFEGRIVSVNRDARTFRLRDAERGTVRIRVTRRTDFERLAGFGALHAGLRHIEVTARRVHGRWKAVDIERSGGGGHHGGDGADDGPGHGADDGPGHDAGDDHGGDD